MFIIKGKGKGHLITGHQGPSGGVGYSSTHSFFNIPLFASLVHHNSRHEM
jgi:hypothetical protein